MPKKSVKRRSIAKSVVAQKPVATKMSGGIIASLLLVVVAVGYVAYNQMVSSVGINEIRETGSGVTAAPRVVQQWDFGTASDLGPRGWNAFIATTGEDKQTGENKEKLERVNGAKIENGSLVVNSKQLSKRNVLLSTGTFNYPYDAKRAEYVESLTVNVTLTADFVRPTRAVDDQTALSAEIRDGKRMPESFEHKMRLILANGDDASSAVITSVEASKTMSGLQPNTATFSFVVPLSELNKRQVRSMRIAVNPDKHLLASVSLDQVVVKQTLKDGMSEDLAPYTTNVTLTGKLTSRALDSASAPICILTSDQGVEYALAGKDRGVRGLTRPEGVWQEKESPNPKAPGRVALCDPFEQYMKMPRIMVRGYLLPKAKVSADSNMMTVVGESVEVIVRQ